jgi:hypothetical protein
MGGPENGGVIAGGDPGTLPFDRPADRVVGHLLRGMAPDRTGLPDPAQRFPR